MKSTEPTAVTQFTSDRPRPDADPRSTAALIIAATGDASAQFADLLRLARIEVRGNLRAVATLAGLFGGAMLLVLVSLIALRGIGGRESMYRMPVYGPDKQATALTGRLAVA